MWQVRCSGPRLVTVIVNGSGVMAAARAEGASVTNPPVVIAPASSAVATRRTVRLLAPKRLVEGVLGLGEVWSARSRDACCDASHLVVRPVQRPSGGLVTREIRCLF